MKTSEQRNIAIIGGGASGIFAAIRCAEVAKEKNININIKVFEASKRFLKKVKISGGGRCNVTHHIFDPKNLILNYPRGKKELLSPFIKFQASDTVKWFEDRGVKIKHEKDGRMFPVTDNSETIIDCFMKETKKYKVQLVTQSNIKSIKKLENGKLSLLINKDKNFIADSVLIATGSMPSGYRLAKTLGHTITEIAPSLFTFKIEDLILENLAGTSFANSSLTLKINNAKEFYQKGPLLITHWGLSGPALLKLSAWAAREMMHSNYKAKIIINWLGLESINDVKNILNNIKNNNTKVKIGNVYPLKITKRFWLQLLMKSGVEKEKNWSEINKKEFNIIVTNLFNCELEVLGKSRFKEEFVECGGINLKEINFKNMESKVCPGIYFSGEIMDIDGITGGFNFQNAWTSGWIAGSNMALKKDTQ
ncbi:MAG: aminoacetone oxidase family FAD-binding enzyme [Gammaproteobacteria bacterium]|nr:aminoacetone oxidase family FAD-binding enzyme [Gammaproteobacteria bacterium]|tara:strand:+ start:308 stop:1573 length:1266 start_codon:yes stop_codon:yes gene_type:complete